MKEMREGGGREGGREEGRKERTKEAPARSVCTPPDGSVAKYGFGSGEKRHNW